jgi:type I restriction enzyme S subunit
MGAVTKSSNSGGTMPTMSQEAVLNIPVVLPLQSEQQAIIEYIDCNLNKIDKLVEKTLQSLDLLKEHRTALISAAVTGKIDVRNHAGSINNNKLEVA